jgi:predicted phosphodiesterase
LENTIATVYEIPPSITTGTIGLVVSDQHIGRNGDPTLDVESFVGELGILISHFDPNYVLMLGDTLQWNCSNPFPTLHSIFEQLSEFRIPIFVLGGNHDRGILKSYPHEHERVTLVRDALTIGITATGHDQGYGRIIFGHDLGNTFGVNPRDVHVFVWWMKEVFRSIVGAEDLLFLGHTHQNIWDSEHKCCSVGMFAPQHNKRKWGVIGEKGGFEVRLQEWSDLDK